MDNKSYINIKNAKEHNLKGISIDIPRNKLIVITGVSGSGKSSLAFDTILVEAQRRFFYTLSHYSRQFLNLNTRPTVEKISGLSPAIALMQNETQLSKKSMVSSLTDIGELLGILLSRFGVQLCPKHQKPTKAISPEDITDRLLSRFDGQMIAIVAPIVENKKGNFKKILTKFQEKGFLRLYCNGEIIETTPLPELEREKRHTIKLVVDITKVNSKKKTRIFNSILTALKEGDSFIECYPIVNNSNLDIENGFSYSSKSGCSICGFSWPKLDPRYFSTNSLGKCHACDGWGGKFESEIDTESFDFLKQCQSCSGTGLDEKYQSIRFDEKSSRYFNNCSIGELFSYFSSIDLGHHNNNPAFIRVKSELVSLLEGISKIGLEYLTPSRRISSLSGGELQRLKLANILSRSLTGVLYIFDEPSQGLHPNELNNFFQSLIQLKNQGNSIIIVDHDEYILRNADQIIDLGPGGGGGGGNIVATFSPNDSKNFISRSLTAKYLNKEIEIENTSKNSKKDFYCLKDLSCHNLNISKVRFQIGSFNVISGVSGAGKSSLVIGTFYRNVVSYLNFRSQKNDKFSLADCREFIGLEKIQSISLVKRDSLAKSPVSFPATYLGFFTEIRKLFANTKDAQVKGFGMKSFSLRLQEGRCEDCAGRGELILEMKFLDDARVKCSSCTGQRYKQEVLSIRFKGLNIAEVLDLSIDQALLFFKNYPKISKPLKHSHVLGLGYLKLGQSLASWSGGEAQRLRLVPYMAKKWDSGHILILDEPTRGLHFFDVQKLILALKEIVSKKVTILAIEHHSYFIKSADWNIDLGPYAAKNGGQLVFEGVPHQLISCKIL